MKITFEGETMAEIMKQMDRMVDEIEAAAQAQAEVRTYTPPIPAPPPVDVFGENPVDKPVEKPRRERTEKQKANDEKLRLAALAKKKKPEPVKAAPPPAPKKAALSPPLPPVEEPDDEEEEQQSIDPADLIKLRMKTIEDLQAAYAGGFQKEVFELLSRFGDGAKSFREVPVEAFPAIRDAIDKGALT